jgi:two-component system NarL family sensor kinase
VSTSRNRGASASMRRDRGSRRGSAGKRLRPADPTSALPESTLAQLFVDHADEFIGWISMDGRLLYGNPALCRVLGYSQAEFTALHVWDISPRTPESWPARFQELKQLGSQTLVAELHTKTGEIVTTRFNQNYAAVGGKEFVLCCGHDLREKKVKASEVTAASRADAIFVLREGQVEGGDPRNPELFGASRQQIIDELESILGESGPMRDAMARALAGNEATFDWQSRRPDGSRFTIECTLCRIEIDGQVRLLAVAVDVTARRRSEWALAQLSGRLLEMQDEERRRIARDLHDNTGQNLGALSIGLSMILSTARIDPRTRQALKESLALADSSVREIRTISYLLHPPLLDELGLQSALRTYAEGYSERTGIQLDLDFPLPVLRLPQAVEIALFRIVQEGLTNIHRHSGSERATLRVRHEADRVELELIDYGRGLPPGTIEWDMPSASRIGVGIAGMRERARQLGGRLTIASGETGTTLHVVLPLLQPQ